MPTPYDEFVAPAVTMSGQAHHRRQDQDIVASLATEMLRSFGEFRFVAWGGSMVPSIFPGDTLIVHGEAARTARRGDVVLFFREGRFCAHRLVDKAEEDGFIHLITRGDALGKNDPPFAEDELLGRVAAVIRGRKRIDLGECPAASERLLRWSVQRSRGAVKWLLRWHSLRTRVARWASATFWEIRLKPLGSV